MRVDRAFMFMGSLYIIVGVMLGMKMGAAQDFTIAPVHAHVNLLGYVTMFIFGFTYHFFPKMRDHVLATVHFWLHQTCVPILLILLYLVLTGAIEGSSLDIIAPILEGLILIGFAMFSYLIFTFACKDD